MVFARVQESNDAHRTGSSILESASGAYLDSIWVDVSS